MNLDARIPEGPLQEKWRIWKDNHELVGPRRRGPTSSWLSFQIRHFSCSGPSGMRASRFMAWARWWSGGTIWPVARMDRFR